MTFTRDDRTLLGDSPAQAAEALAAKLMAEGLECCRLNLPKGMDVNEYALKVKPAAQSLGILLRSATWLPRPTMMAFSSSARR